MIGKAASTASSSLIPLQVEQRPPEKRPSIDANDDDGPATRLDHKLP
jgi:conjugal transfer pilus assembly protein TraV